MRKKAVVFDLDGTLINSLPDISSAMNRVLAEYKLPTHDERAYRLFTGDGARNLTLRALGERREMLPQVLAAYAREYGENSRVNTAPYAGITQMLAALSGKGLLLCILSNKDEPDTQQVVAHYFPGQPFALVRGRREGVPLKPDPTALLQMAAQLKLPPEDFWYVGDTKTDMLCAAGAGMESIAVAWGYQTREEIAGGKPAHYAGTAGELTSLLTS